MATPSGAMDPGLKVGITDEWKEARTVIDNADTQLGTLRQYGFTIVSGLLAAQGLIEFPLKQSPSIVPVTVKLAILIATYVLIVGLFDLDLRTRLIQRAASARAAELEGDRRLTSAIKAAYNPHQHIMGADLTYGIFIISTTILGIAVLASYPFELTVDYEALVAMLLIAAGISGGVVYGYSKKLRVGARTVP